MIFNFVLLFPHRGEFRIRNLQLVIRNLPFRLYRIAQKISFAWDTQLDCKLAIKFLPEHPTKDKHSIE